MPADPSPQPVAFSRKAILICGMHRSGTSVLTRACNFYGADLGLTVSGTGPDNPTGFWENAGVMQLNQDLMARLGLDWTSILSPPEMWWTADWVTSFRQRALDVLKAEFGDSRLIAIKDPRMSRLLGFWLEVLERSGMSAHLVIALRHPSEVAQSLARRNRMARARAYLLWLWHTLDALALAPAGRSCVLTYDGLMSRGPAMLEEAAALLGIDWQTGGKAAAARLADFLSPALRHHAASKIAPSFWKPLDEAVADVYTALSQAPVSPVAGLKIEPAVVELARLVAHLGGEDVLRLATPTPPA
jgi:hypothetical protein